MNISIPVKEKYKRKSECAREARLLVANGLDMSVNDCAKEIYTHAQIFYKTNLLRSLFSHDPKIFNWLVEHANPIDLVDGGDIPARRIIYNLIWKLT